MKKKNLHNTQILKHSYSCLLTTHLLYKVHSESINQNHQVMVKKDLSYTNKSQEFLTARELIDFEIVERKIHINTCTIKNHILISERLVLTSKKSPYLIKGERKWWREILKQSRVGLTSRLTVFALRLNQFRLKPAPNTCAWVKM